MNATLEGAITTLKGIPGTECQPCKRAGIDLPADTSRRGETVCADCAAEIDEGREP